MGNFDVPGLGAVLVALPVLFALLAIFATFAIPIAIWSVIRRRFGFWFYTSISALLLFGYLLFEISIQEQLLERHFAKPLNLEIPRRYDGASVHLAFDGFTHGNNPCTRLLGDESLGKCAWKPHYMLLIEGMDFVETGQEQILRWRLHIHDERCLRSEDDPSSHFISYAAQGICALAEPVPDATAAHMITARRADDAPFWLGKVMTYELFDVASGALLDRFDEAPGIRQTYPPDLATRAYERRWKGPITNLRSPWLRRDFFPPTIRNYRTLELGVVLDEHGVDFELLNRAMDHEDPDIVIQALLLACALAQEGNLPDDIAARASRTDFPALYPRHAAPPADFAAFCA